jgi:membrane-bound metal-dependent hydrolase YbcI (DUF457 family)
MLIRTHIALSMLVILLFLPHISNKFLFIGFGLLATFLPDIDSGFSTLGKNRGMKVLQVFTRHRGFIHSFTFCIMLSVLLAIFWPAACLGFFLGYSLHLFADSFTPEGVTPFWPYKGISKWYLKTGSRIETTFFISLAALDLLVFIFLFMV